MGSMKDKLGDQPFMFGLAPAVAIPDEWRGIPVEVMSLFERFSSDLRQAGFDHYSADAILHRIRWHYHVERGDREFKCNNNWTSALSRWLMEKHPDMRGFFETRALASERGHG